MADPAYIDPGTGALTDGDAWVEIQTQTLLDSDPEVSAVTFSTGTGTQNFSQYLDMTVIGAIAGSGSGTISSNSLYARFNDDDSSSYRGLQIYNTGSTLTHYNWGLTSQIQPGDLPGNTDAGNVVGFFKMQLHDTNAGKWTSGVAYTGSQIQSVATDYIRTSTFQYQKTDAINEIKVYGSVGTRACRISLYGLLPKMVS